VEADKPVEEEVQSDCTDDQQSFLEKQIALNKMKF
jgi:hypothetical protein